MRTAIGWAVVLAGLCLAGSAQAQVTTNTSSAGSFVVTQVPTTTTASNSSITGAFNTTFRLRDLLTGLTSLWSPQAIGKSTTIPDPGTPAYLQAFGYQKFRR
jgi:hypothetical protein